MKAGWLAEPANPIAHSGSLTGVPKRAYGVATTHPNTHSGTLGLRGEGEGRGGG